SAGTSSVSTGAPDACASSSGCAAPIPAAASGCTSISACSRNPRQGPPLALVPAASRASGRDICYGGPEYAQGRGEMAASRLKATALAVAVAVSLGGAPQMTQAQSLLLDFGFGWDGIHRRWLPRPCFMTDHQIREAVARRG